MGGHRTTPPAANPEAGQNPGYAEDEPRDRADIRHPHGKRGPSPDEGGLEREADPASDDQESESV